MYKAVPAMEKLEEKTYDLGYRDVNDDDMFGTKGHLYKQLSETRDAIRPLMNAPGVNADEPKILSEVNNPNSKNMPRVHSDMTIIDTTQFQKSGKRVMDKILKRK